MPLDSNIGGVPNSELIGNNLQWLTTVDVLDEDGDRAITGFSEDELSEYFFENQNDTIVYFPGNATSFVFPDKL